MKNSRILIRGLDAIVTMNGPASGHDLLIEGQSIARVGTVPPGETEGAAVIAGGGLIAMPGFVQTHVHLCQTILRNQADDLELLDWLSKRVWPGEAMLDYDTLGLTAQMGIAELLLGGTTCILDMATMRHTDAVFQALADSGMRAVSGKCLMDDPETCPAQLVESTDMALGGTEELIDKWHGYDNGRLQVAVTPRFAVSCTTPLMKKAVELAGRRGTLIHTHASENRGEIELVRKRTGLGNLEYLESVGFLGPNACVAHCVHLDADDFNRLEKYNVKVLHCPGSNLKLASGIAPVPQMLERGICVSIGADGAPCNNTLDMFTEMRLAGLIQKPVHGPRSMPAETVLKLATSEGARALGKEKEIGMIKEGMRADIILVNMNEPHSLPADRVESALVYAGRATDVRHVFVDGRHLVNDGALTRGNLAEWKTEFAQRARALVKRL